MTYDLKNSENFEFESFENALSELLKKNPNKFLNEIEEFVCTPASKRLRPKLIFACLNALDLPVTKAQMNVALAVEILHNATLIHDDIIDESTIRRGAETFYKKYGAKMSVILGDFLLSVSLKTLCEISNPKILEIFSKNLVEICNGEINQYFLKNKIPTLEQYIEKTTQKTALLFVCGVSSAFELCEIDIKKRENLENFALNFGIAFQIKNDINDYKNGKKDYKSGIYTLADIYFEQYGNNHDIIEEKCDAIKEEFIQKAERCIEFLEDNKKLELMGFLNSLRG